MSCGLAAEAYTDLSSRKAIVSSVRTFADQRVNELGAFLRRQPAECERDGFKAAGVRQCAGICAARFRNMCFFPRFLRIVRVPLGVVP